MSFGFRYCLVYFRFSCFFFCCRIWCLINCFFLALAASSIACLASDFDYFWLDCIDCSCTICFASSTPIIYCFIDMAFGFRYCLVYFALAASFLLLLHPVFDQSLLLALAHHQLLVLLLIFDYFWLDCIDCSCTICFCFIHTSIIYCFIDMAFGFRYRLVYFRFCSFFSSVVASWIRSIASFLALATLINCLSCFYFFVISGWIALIKFVPFILAVSTFSF